MDVIEVESNNKSRLVAVLEKTLAEVHAGQVDGVLMVVRVGDVSKLRSVGDFELLEQLGALELLKHEVISNVESIS